MLTDLDFVTDYATRIADWARGHGWSAVVNDRYNDQSRPILLLERNKGRVIRRGQTIAADLRSDGDWQHDFRWDALNAWCDIKGVEGRIWFVPDNWDDGLIARTLEPKAARSGVGPLPVCSPHGTLRETRLNEEGRASP